jgi:diguanylate cyclase (GGDEF)-like protein
MQDEGSRRALDVDADAVVRACRAARETFSAKRASVWLFDSVENCLWPYVSEAGTPEDLGAPSRAWARIPLASFPAAASVLLDRVPASIDDAILDPRLPPGFATDFNMTSVALLPLYTGRPVGVLAIEPGPVDRSPAGDWIVSFVAATAGGALAWKEADALREEFRLLAGLTEAIAGQDSLAGALKAVRNQFLDRLVLNSAWLFSRLDGRLQLRAGMRWDGQDFEEPIEEMDRVPSLGLVDAVAGSGFPAVATAQDSPLISDWWWKEIEGRAALAVPLGTKPNITGVCVLSSTDERGFSKDDVRFASVAGIHLAGLLGRTQASDERAYQLKASSEIQRLFESGSRAVSVEEVAEVLARVTSDVAGTEQGTVLIKDSEGRISHILGAGVPYKTLQRLKEWLIGLPAQDFPLWGLIGDKPTPVFVENANEDDLLPRELASFELKSYVLLPLVSAEGPVGAVICSNTRMFKKWNEEQRRLVTQLSIEGSIIVENALLRAADQQRLHEMAYQAFHDHLTKLPNRTLFDDRVEHALARADRRHEAVAVLFVDVDNFKAINARLGHEGGDGLLVALSRRLQECLRPEDTIARLGGDEFSVLVEDVGGDDTVGMIADRVAKRLQEPFIIDGEQILLTISIGIALSWPGCMEAGELVRNADLAMYRAKYNGKARVEFFNFEKDALGRGELEAESALRRAVEDKEFVLHYQPKVDLHSGKLVGMEALLRWDDPARGMIPPLDFIPLAESTGLIVPIGEWVMETVCFQVRRWREWWEEKRVPTVWVNLSAREFQRADLIESINELLVRSEVLQWQLGLEITETTMMDDAEGTVDLLKRLHSLGVKLALDDFGAGYSSLSYLKRFPVDALKIDRQFVRGLPNAQDEAIVRAVVTLAQTLGQRVVAEGIETLEQLWLLRELGAQIGQGFYFSKPVPVKGAEALVANTPDWVPLVGPAPFMPALDSNGESAARNFAPPAV